MKNKKMTYVLGAVLVVVWGLILFRVFDAMGADDGNDLPVAATKPLKEEFNDYSIPKDTTHLLLNYRDPFGLAKEPDTVKVKVKTTSSQNLIPKPVIPQINWNFIKYAGYIRNPDTKKLIAILKINDKNIMLTEGESAEKVRLVKNMIDSIKVNYKGIIKFIAMHSSL